MAKRTAVIDLGSKSFRLVIFQKSSRFGFSIIKESRAGVSIGKDIHQNNGVLQEKDFSDSISIIKQFSTIISSLKAKKVLCVATSVIRNAPNRNEFKNKIFKQTGIKIKIIDGESEARLGAIATLNLLPIKDFITMDTGGGSTEISLVKNGKIEQNISLDMGTVRLKSIFEKIDFNKKDIDAYINSLIDTIPSKFYNYPLVAFGGTARTVAKTIMSSSYPIPTVHGFSFSPQELLNQYENIITSDKTQLLQMGISKNRVGDIKMGVSIFANLVKRLEISKITTSGVGIREGVFLNDMLRTNNHIFPKNFHIGMRNMEDRFIDDKNLLKSQKKHISKLFEALNPIHNIEDEHKKYLSFAVSIFQASCTFDIHKTNNFSSYLITNSTIYELSHEDKLILSTMMKYSSKKTIKEKDYISYSQEYPSYKTIYWLSFMHMLIANIIFDSTKNFSFTLENDELNICCENKDPNIIIEKQLILNIELPKDIKITLT